MNSMNYYNYSNYSITPSAEKAIGAYSFFFRLKDGLESGHAIQTPNSDITTIATTIWEGYHEAYYKKRCWICRAIDWIQEYYGIDTEYSRVSTLYKEVLRLATHIPNPAVLPLTTPTTTVQHSILENSEKKTPSPPTPPPETIIPIPQPEVDTCIQIISGQQPVECVKPKSFIDSAIIEKLDIKKSETLSTSVQALPEETHKAELQKSSNLQLEASLVFIEGLQKKLNNTSFQQELIKLKDLKAQSKDIASLVGTYISILKSKQFQEEKLASSLEKSVDVFTERRMGETLKIFVERMENSMESLNAILQSLVDTYLSTQSHRAIRKLCLKGLQRIRLDAEKERQRLIESKQLTEEDLNLVRAVVKNAPVLEYYANHKTLEITFSISSMFSSLDYDVEHAYEQLLEVQRRFKLSKSHQLESLESDLNHIRTSKFISAESKEKLQHQLNAAKQIKNALDKLKSLYHRSTDIEEIKKAVESLEKELQGQQSLLALLMEEMNKEFTKELSKLKRYVAGLERIVPLGQQWTKEPTFTDLKSRWKNMNAAYKGCKGNSLSKAIHQQALKDYGNFNKIDDAILRVSKSKSYLSDYFLIEKFNADLFQMVDSTLKTQLVQKVITYWTTVFSTTIRINKEQAVNKGKFNFVYPNIAACEDLLKRLKNRPDIAPLQEALSQFQESQKYEKDVIDLNFASIIVGKSKADANRGLDELLEKVKDHPYRDHFVTEINLWRTTLKDKN